MHARKTFAILALQLALISSACTTKEPAAPEYKFLTSAQGPVTCADEPNIDLTKVLTDLQLAEALNQFRIAGADCRAGIKTWSDIVKTWPAPEVTPQPKPQTWWQRNFGTK